MRGASNSKVRSLQACFLLQQGAPEETLEATLEKMQGIQGLT